MQVKLCFLHGPAGNRYRIADAVARLGREDGNPDPLTKDLQLADRVRPLQVRRDQQRRVALFAQPAGQLGGERGLT